MTDIHISVKDKIAIKTDKTFYVCGNSDFRILFDFDTEWNAYETKTARFSHDGSYTDIVFSGSECAVPIISDIYCFHVGVYAGDLHTTTPARVPCRKSILCGGGIPADPAPDVYNQLMERINELESPDWSQNDAAGKGYIKNRTHYTELYDGGFLYPERVAQVLSGKDGYMQNAQSTSLTIKCTFVVGATYKLVVDDVAHMVSFEAGEHDPRQETDWFFFGLNINPYTATIRDTSIGAALYFQTGVDNDEANITPGEEFSGDFKVIVPKGTVNPTVSISIIWQREVVHQLDAKYIPATTSGITMVNGAKEWDNENEEYIVTLDKNFEQMREAQQNGAFIVAKIGSKYYMQMYAGADKIQLSLTSADDEVIEDIIAYDDGSIRLCHLSIPTFGELEYLFDIIPTDEHINDLINQALAGIPDASEVAY